MSWNKKRPDLAAYPERQGERKVYRVTNVGGATARGIRATFHRQGEDATDWLRVRIPDELAPNASFLLGLSRDFRGFEMGQLTLHWVDADGESGKWGNAICAW